LLDAFLWWRQTSGHPLGLPHLPADWGIWAPMVILVVLFGLMMLMPLMSGRSPHVMIRPEHIELGLSESEGTRRPGRRGRPSLNVFLGYATFREVLGGNPRRGILFEGRPGRQDLLAKAMAKQAGVPFLFVSAPRLPVDVVRHDEPQDPLVLQGAAQGAQREGGAIGFIEEIDAIGGDRASLACRPRRTP
jgi:hypothetical protein